MRNHHHPVESGLHAFREVAATDLPDRPWMHVRYRYQQPAAVMPGEEDADLGQCDLLSYLLEVFFEGFRPVGQVCKERIDEVQAADMERSIERPVYEPDQDDETHTENCLQEEREGEKYRFQDH